MLIGGFIDQGASLCTHCNASSKSTLWLWLVKTVSGDANVVVDLCGFSRDSSVKLTSSSTWKVERPLTLDSMYLYSTVRGGRKRLSQMRVQEQGSGLHGQMGIQTTRLCTTIIRPSFSQVTRSEPCVTIDVCVKHDWTNPPRLGLLNKTSLRKWWATMPWYLN